MLLAKKCGSLMGLRKILGWFVSHSCDAVVPVFEALTLKKSRWFMSQQCRLY